MFKTIYSRFGNVKAGKFVASQEEMNSSNYNEEEFESINDIETVLSSIGIKLRENAKEWRDIDDVLQDIADSWDNWDKTTQNAVATAIAGTRQRENVLQLFDNWDEVDKYAEIAANSYGTATEKMEAYTDSVEAAQQRIQVAIEDWALWANGAGYIKDFYNAIGFAIENMHHLIAVVGALAIVLNLNGIINTFSNGLTIMASKLTDIGMLFDKAKMNLSLGRNSTINAYSGGVDTVREDFIFAQQQMFGQALAKYTSTLNAQDAQAVQNMQKEMLRMSSTDKLTVAQTLLTNAQLTDISDESAKHLANALLLVLNENERSVILQKIASGEKLSETEHGLAALNNALKRVREKEYAQAVGNTMSKSGAMGEPRSMISTGIGMTLGGIAGGNAGGNLGEFLGGDSGKIYGTVLGGMIGSYGGKALMTVLGTSVSTALKSGLLKGLTAGIAAIPGLGWVAIGATVAGLFFSGWKKKKEEALKEAEEEFKAAEEQYSAAKGSNTTAKQFDELAKGVDSLGRNISLTDEEYQSFLDKSNELAELFPDLVVRTDEAGNKLIGLGNIVGGVAEEVANLNKELRHKADEKLLNENTWGQAFDKTYNEGIADYEEKIYQLENYELVGDTDTMREVYDKYGVEYTMTSGVISSVKDEEKALKARTLMIEEYRREIEKLKGANKDYNNAFARELEYSNTDFQKQIEQMSDEEKTVYQNMIDNLDTRQTDENGNAIQDSLGNYISKSDDEIKESIQDIANLVDDTFNKLGEENIEIAFKGPESYNTLEEMQKARQQLMDALMSIFGADGVIDDTEAQIIIGLGFEVKDNSITDPQDILNNFRELGVAEKIGIGNDAITVRKLSSLSPEDAKSAFELMNSGIVKVTGSWQTLLNLINSDKGPVETVEGYSQYFQMLLAQEEGFQDEFNKVIDSRRENKNIKMSAGYILSGMTDEEIDESFSQYNSTIRGGIKNAKKNYEKNINEYGKSVEEANQILQKELDGLFNASKFNTLNEQLKLQLSLDFSGVDLGDDGLVNSFSELKDVLDSLSDSYDRLKEAQTEYNTTGKLSMQTVLDLISTDQNYLNVLDLSGDTIKLRDDAEQTLMNSKINTAKASILQMRNELLLESQQIQNALTSDDLVTANEILQQSSADSITKNNALTNSLVQQSNAALAAARGLQAKNKAEEGATDTKADENAAIVYQGKAGRNDTIKAPDSGDTKKSKKLDANTREKLLTKYEQNTGISRGDAFVIGRDGQVLASKIDLNQDKYLNGGGFSFGGSIGALDKLYSMDTWDNFQKKYKTPDTKNTKDTKDSKYDPMTQLEKLKKLASLIDKEYEAMVAKNADKYTEYFKKMGDNLAEQKKAVLEEIVLLSAELEKLTPGTEEYDKKYSELNERQTDLIDIEKKIANLRDEEIEDEISRLNNREASVEALIEQQKLLLQEADTEDEIIERQKGLNDLLRQERDLRKSINEYQNELLDTQLQYNSGTAYSDSKTYDNLVSQKVENYKKNAEIALEAIEAETRLAYNELIQEVDDKGNKLYTAQEAWYKAQNSEKVQQATKEYIEAVQAQAEVAVQAVTDKLDEISREIDMLEKQKPQEWSSIDQIKDYADSTIDYLNKKLAIIQEALKDTSGMTDDQIKDLVDQLNEVTIAIHEAQIQMHEDIKSKQEATYSALVNQVQRYIDELERAKDAVEDAYKNPIEDIEDYNKALDRTNKLLELQKNLQNASREKQRVKDMPSIKMAI